jgi:hypothetical protein
MSKISVRIEVVTKHDDGTEDRRAELLRDVKTEQIDISHLITKRDV